MTDGSFGNVYRLLFVSHGKNFYALLLTIYLKLCNSCRPVYITGNQKRTLAFCLQLTCKLGRRSGLTSSLKTCHHDHCHIIAWLNRKLCSLTAHQAYKLVIYDLDHHLSRIQTIHYILSYCTLLHRLGKLLDHLEIDICFKKSHLNFFQSDLNIFFCQPAFTSQLFEYIL